MPVSQRKLEANRRNAQLSTGPRTDEGKARSAANATSHGLFCHAIVLPGESMEVFTSLRNSLIQSLKPQDTAELMLVDRIVIANWKLRRLQEAEAQLFAADEQEVSEEYEPEPGEESAAIGASEILAAQLDRENTNRFERLSRYEQRLENSIHRAMRQLRRFREAREKHGPLPESPFCCVPLR